MAGPLFVIYLSFVVDPSDIVIFCSLTVALLNASTDCDYKLTVFTISVVICTSDGQKCFKIMALLMFLDKDNSFFSKGLLVVVRYCPYSYMLEYIMQAQIKS